jgi:hypothetical protein
MLKLSVFQRFDTTPCMEKINKKMKGRRRVRKRLQKK